MSKEAIQEVVQALEALPEADQRLVLNFLTTLKRHRSANGSHEAASDRNPALATKGGLLIFTGKVDAPTVDWVQWERDERDNELVQATLGRTTRP